MPLGARVQHRKRGRGLVVEHTPNSAIRIAFDDGNEGIYDADAQAKYIKVLSDYESRAEQLLNNQELIGNQLNLRDIILFYIPAFLLQIPLWLPISVYPPLEAKLSLCFKHWWLLNSPVLKFSSFFALDVLFFIVMTLLSNNPRHGSTGFFMAGLVTQDDTIRNGKLFLLLQCLGILLNEAKQYVKSRDSLILLFQRIRSGKSVHLPHLMRVLFSVQDLSSSLDTS